MLRSLLIASLALTGTASAQIPLGGGTHGESFDVVLAGGATALPPGWSTVGNGVAAPALSVSDTAWAGTAASGYNAALQTDVSQAGDSLPDRGLAIYATGANESRHITASFLNATGGVITGLALSFEVCLYAARWDSTSANKRWDGLLLRLDPGTGAFTTIAPALQATFGNDLVTFANGGGDPWATGGGWATPGMIAGPHKQTVAAVLTNLSIAPGATFKLRWASNDGGVRPAAPATPAGALQYNLTIGVDNVSITPTFTPPSDPPEPPSDLLATTLNSSKIILDWTDNSLAETGFRIERAAAVTGPWTPVGSVPTNTTTVTATGLAPQTEHFFRVVAVNQAGDSAPCAPDSATTLAPDPGLVRFVDAVVSVNENVAGGTVTLRVERFFDSAGAVTVNYATLDGTATVADSDYAATTGTLGWASGEEGIKSFTVPISNDNRIEDNEEFQIGLSGATGGLVIDTPPVTTVTIVNDDFPGQLRFAAATLAVSEGSGTATLTVQRVTGSVGAATVDFATTGFTAVPGEDFAERTGTLAWADGDATARTIEVPILNDAAGERTQYFTVALDNPVGMATLGTPATATVTIQDDDPGFLLLDNFTDNLADLPVFAWTMNPSAADAQFVARTDPVDPANIVGGIKRLSSNNSRAWYLPLAGDAIPQGAKGTVFLRLRLAGGADADRFNLSVGLSDETTPSNNFAHFEAQAIAVNTTATATPLLQVRNGGTSPQQGTLAKNTWHSLWFVVDNQADTYDVYLRGDGGHATTADRIATGFAFRNAAAANPLRHVLVMLGQNTTNNPEVFLDDLYLDRAARNLRNPLNSAPYGYAAWRDTAFPAGTPDDQREPDADLDLDGLDNLLEYALGTDPAAASAMPAPTVAEVAGKKHLQLQWTRPDDRGDLTTSGEAAVDLAGTNWFSAPPATATTTTPAGPGMETVTVRDLDPLGSHPRRFLRVRVALDAGQ